VRQVEVTWKLAFHASCVTCPQLIREDMKLGLQVTMGKWHSSNREDSLYSWFATCQAPI